MPRTLKDLKETNSKNSIQNRQDDPSKNTTMGNVKLLYDKLEGYLDINQSFSGQSLRSRLDNILKAHDGQVSEDIGALNIALINHDLNNLYSEIDASSKMSQDERTELKNLLEYVYAGLEPSSDGHANTINPTDEQKNNIKLAEEKDTIEVLSEYTNGKSGLNVLDRYKNAVKAMPKTFRGPDAKKAEANALYQLKEHCFDIMATRRSINAERNNKAGLKKAVPDGKKIYQTKQNLKKNKVLNDFLNSMSYKDFRTLAEDGHGGAMEDKFTDYLKKGVNEIPKDAPSEYMPSAKDRIEALQDKMKSSAFLKQTSVEDQRKLYVEMMATRAAVGSVRRDKSSLAGKVNPDSLDKVRESFKKEPLATALSRVTSNKDDLERARKAAIEGHGGALEDLVRMELRKMAVEKKNDYKMKPVSSRYAPTYDERQFDLTLIVDDDTVSASNQLRAAIELNELEKTQADQEGTAKIEDIGSLNNKVDAGMARFADVLSEADMRSFAKDSVERGYDMAVQPIEKKYAGRLQAAKMSADIDAKLSADPKPSMADLQKLIAQKMVLHKETAALNNKIDKDAADPKLFGEITNEKMTNKVSLLTSDKNFQDMFKVYSPEKLAKEAQGFGNGISRIFADVREGKFRDKLEGNVVKNAQVKAQVKNEEKGPQQGGPQA